MSAASLAIPAAGVRTRSPKADPLTPERPGVRLLSFAALGLYGMMRWGTLLAHAPVGRLLGLLAVATFIVGAGGVLTRRHRGLVLPVALAGMLSVLALAGLPVSWVLHARLAASADAIGEGLSALPRVFVPYSGIHDWVQVVILLGAGVLLLDAALMLAFAPRSLGDLRKTAAALPLVTLAVLPSTIARPHLPYLHGLIVFLLVCGFVWGERLSARRGIPAAALATLAGASAVVAAPALDRHHAWLSYQSLSASLSPGDVEAFDFSQRYGPLRWPRTGRAVLEVKAGRPEYWKAENLDVFDGREWISGAVQQADPLLGADHAAVVRWSQTLQVTIGAMRSTDVIASGSASAPRHVPGPLLAGASPGTWTTATELNPGDTYTVDSYAPEPSEAELASISSEPAGAAGPPPGYRAITLPQVTLAHGAGAVVGLPVLFAPFGSGVRVSSASELPNDQLTRAVETSAYGEAFVLARRLAHSASTPYAYAASIERYLTRGFSYDESPPQRQFPLESFLFKDRIGYCQQFAGAMALLLRIGGIPARVAAGFTTGQYDQSKHRWIVSDLDAHAWVEAWFPHYGWIRFDPTPAAAPARGGHVRLPSLHGASATPPAARPTRRAEPRPARGGPTRPAYASTPKGAGNTIIVALGILVAMVTIALALRLRPRAPGPGDDQLVAELTRALARSGRPVSAGTTLAVLEHRLRHAPKAAGYVCAVRQLRYGSGGEPPSGAERRALRAQLRVGLGVFGRARALWALPPRLRSAMPPTGSSARGPKL